MRNLSDLFDTLTRWAAIILAIAVLLFFAAGTTHILAIRFYIAIFSCFQLIAMLLVDPELARERVQPSASDTKSSLRFASGFLFLLTLAVAAWDAGHLHLRGSLPPEIQISAFALFIVAMSLQTLAMADNPFFSPEIRLQTKRGHHVITHGAYQLLRHPGYLAMLLAVPASALAIGSWLALLCAAAFDLVILRRTYLEDRFLREKLPGYQEYAQSVSGGLLPHSLLPHLMILIALGFIAGWLILTPPPHITGPVILDPSRFLPNASCLVRLLPTPACIETRSCLLRTQDMKSCETQD